MEWTGVEFEIHGVKTQIHAPWPWKKFTVFGEIHKPPFRVKGHILFFLYWIVSQNNFDSFKSGRENW